MEGGGQGAYGREEGEANSWRRRGARARLMSASHLFAHVWAVVPLAFWTVGQPTKRESSDSLWLPVALYRPGHRPRLAALNCMA